MNKKPRLDVVHRWIPILVKDRMDIPEPKEAASLPAPMTGWFGRHVLDQGGGIIALVAAPDDTQLVEGDWAFTGCIQVTVLTTSPRRTSLHLAVVRPGLESAVFRAERLGAYVTVEAVNAVAIYQRPKRGNAVFPLSLIWTTWG